MNNRIEIINVNTPWEKPTELDESSGVDGVSFEFKSYLDKHIKRIAETHLELWGKRYEGKSLSDIEFDLGVNYDISGEATDIGDIYEEKGNPPITDEENNYAQERFIEAVISVQKEELNDLLK